MSAAIEPVRWPPATAEASPAKRSANRGGRDRRARKQQTSGQAFFKLDEQAVEMGLRAEQQSEYGEGADVFAGRDMPAYEECCFIFQGFALPLVDAAENILDDDGSTCDPGYWRLLRYHVRSASTCTVKVGGTWRMYLPEPRVSADDRTAATVFGGPWPRYLPEDATGPARGPVFPDTEWSELTPRFSANYISFVDSPDGGENFPVYGPRVPATSWDGTSGCATAWDTTAADWSSAGWTPTAIPSRTDPDDPAVETDPATGTAVYVIYRDPSVVDLSATYGIYVMIALECRSTSPYYDDDDGSNPCTTGPTGYHRIVAFAATSRDFGAYGTAAGVTPDPRKWSDAVVLLDGGGDPADGTPSDETYGVPCAVLSPDGMRVLLYTSATASSGKTARVLSRYGGAEPLQTALSCFEIPIARLAAELSAPTGSFSAIVEACYVPTKPGVDCSLDVSMIRCARLGDWTDYYSAWAPTADWLLRTQGDYTIFVAPEECFTLFDIQTLLGTANIGVARDPDVVQLDDGTLRITVAGESDAGRGTGPTIGNGLMYLTRVAGCAP